MPERSPSLALLSMEYIPDPVRSTMSIYGVVGSFGLAFNLINPVPILPVDTNTWEPVYDCAGPGVPPNEPDGPWLGLPSYAKLLVTYKNPPKLVSLVLSILEAESICIYSVIMFLLFLHFQLLGNHLMPQLI